MKTISKAWWLGLHLFAVSAFAQSGSGSHGGDEVELEAWSYARAAGFMLQSNADLFDLTIPDADAFYEIMSGSDSLITVEATDETLKDDQGRVRTAINIPAKNLVRINRARWRNIESDASRFGIIGHEFAGAFGSRNDLKYALSKQLRENYEKLYEDGKPIFFGGIYDQVLCNSREVGGSMQYDIFTPKYGNIMIKANENGSYHVFSDGVFAGDCRGAAPRENPELSKDLIANESLIAKADIGVVQLLLFQSKDINAEHSVGSCGYHEGKVWSRLSGGGVIYEHKDNPQDTYIEQHFKRTLATANHLQTALKTGQCAIPFFPGKRLWTVKRMQAEKKRLQELGGRVGYYNAVKQGSQQIDLESARGSVVEGVIFGQWKSEAFKRSNIGPSHRLIVEAFPWRVSKYIRELYLPAGFTKDEIVEAFRHNPEGVLPEVIEEVDEGITLAALKKAGISVQHFTNRWFFKSRDCKTYYVTSINYNNSYEESDAVCISDRLTEIFTRTYTPAEIFKNLIEKVDAFPAALKMLVLGLYKKGVSPSEFLPKTDLGLHLVVAANAEAIQYNHSNRNNGNLPSRYTMIPLSSYKDIFGYRKFLDPKLFTFLCEPQEYNSYRNFHQCTNLKELFLGHTEDLAWLNEAKAPMLNFLKGLGNIHEEQSAPDDVLLVYLIAAGIKLPVLKKFAEMNGYDQDSKPVQYIKNQYGYPEAAVKDGGAGCAELKWIGYDRKSIRETGVCR